MAGQAVAGDVELSSLQRGRLMVLKQAAKDAEVEANKQAVVQERERKRMAAARRTSGAAEAIRARVGERQREVERHLAEARHREEEKVRKAEALAAQLRAKQESKERLRDEIGAHMAAHAQQVKAAKARVRRSELAELGAQFAARMAAPPPACVAGQVLLVEVAPSPTPPSPAPGPPPAAPPASRPSPSKPPAHPRAALAQAPAGSAVSAPKLGPRPGPGSCGGAAPTPSPEPPWRRANGGLGRGSAGGGVNSPAKFPDIQIFTPFGSELVKGDAQPDATPPPQPSRRQQPVDVDGGGVGSEGQAATRMRVSERQGSRSTSGSGGEQPPAAVREGVLAAWARRGKAELLEVLGQIQEVLAQNGDEEEEDASSCTPTSNDCHADGESGEASHDDDAGTPISMPAPDAPTTANGAFTERVTCRPALSEPGPPIGPQSQTGSQPSNGSQPSFQPVAGRPVRPPVSNPLPTGNQSNPQAITRLAHHSKGGRPASLLGRPTTEQQESASSPAAQKQQQQQQQQLGRWGRQGAPGAAPSAGGPRGAGGHRRLQLPPELGQEGEEEQEGGRQAGLQGGGAATPGLGLVEAISPVRCAAAANAMKVETLRMALEKELGPDVFQDVYRFLRHVQQAAVEEEGEEEDGSEGPLGGQEAQAAQLERLMGRSRLHLVRQVHKLITLEDNVFGGR